ncbi:MAG: hypothetical protein HN383_11505 [Verrucomicrobia bacterium]|jgi:hypothetical protein|nr:hypothetical protein [Verrucomicrobiota bacterium]MBT7700766.1 hypothetical protein [Verrucomicrobiota bacterium]
MADVEVKCEECGAPVTLSEYAAMDTISCRGCGSPLRSRAVSPTESVAERLQLKKNEPPPPPEPGAVDAPPAEDEAAEGETWRFQRYIEDSRANIKDKPKNASLLLSWLCFLILAAGMGYARYFNGVPADYLEMIKTYGPYLALAIHFFILLMAFKDTVFQGILCLLIPGYSVFYLFFVSDNFWMRSVSGGLLVGIAYDSVLHYRDFATRIYSVVTEYIASGG